MDITTPRSRSRDRGKRFGERLSRKNAPPRYEQLRLCRNMHGGWRPGSGRRRSRKAGVPHQTRPRVNRHLVVHVTMKVQDGLRGLRNGSEHQEVWRHLVAGSQRDGFRIVHATVQSNHLHLLCEGDSRNTLWRGLCGVATRIAKGLNRLWGRRGPVFQDRSHDRVMGSPAEVRRALAYLFGNAAHHGRPPREGFVDARSTAPLVRWLDSAAPECSASRRASIGGGEQLLAAGRLERRGLLNLTT